MMNEKIYSTLLALESLTLFKEILTDDIVQHFHRLLKACCSPKIDPCTVLGAYTDFIHTFTRHQAEKDLLGSFSLKAHLQELVKYLDTPFSKAAQQVAFLDVPPYIIKAVESDLHLLHKISLLSASDIKEVLLKNAEGRHLTETIRNLPEWPMPLEPLKLSDEVSYSEDSRPLFEYYKENGSGLFARYKGFVWERQGERGRLRGIDKPDPVRLEDFIGYELQRSQVVENTLQFLKGHPANNLLLYGKRGTGKSSTVKALLNTYHTLGLRMIELPRIYLSDFPEIIRIVGDRPQRFIVFIDDLSFEDHEESYTYLKAVLEGGLETRPENLLIYATTNRRHLVKERFSDRKGLLSDQGDDEVHAEDTMQEKLSLADRFGITITFGSPDQEKYLEIVEGLVRQKGLSIDSETLKKEAIRWEMWYNGRSPRTAHQFVNWLEGHLE